MNEYSPAVPEAPTIGRLASMRESVARTVRTMTIRAAPAVARMRAVASVRRSAAAELSSGPWRPLLAAAVFVAFAMSLTAATDLSGAGRSASYSASVGGPRPAAPPVPPSAPTSPSTASGATIAPDDVDESTVRQHPAPKRESSDARPQRQPHRDTAAEREAELADRMADHRAEMERMAERLRQSWKDGR